MTTVVQDKPLGPFKLVTVNTNPERAKVLVGRVLDGLKDRFTVDYVANSTKIEGVKAMAEEHKPDIMFTASMWTPEEAQRIVAIGKEVVPNLKTMSMPQGLRVEKGPDAVVEYAISHLPEILGQP